MLPSSSKEGIGESSTPNPNGLLGVLWRCEEGVGGEETSKWDERPGEETAKTQNVRRELQIKATGEETSNERISGRQFYVNFGHTERRNG